MEDLNPDELVRLLENEFGNLKDFSSRFSFASTRNLTEDTTQCNVPVQDLKRRMPYLENFHLDIRTCPDRLFYLASPSYRKKGFSQ